jgi:AhpC/TSA family
MRSPLKARLSLLIGKWILCTVLILTLTTYARGATDPYGYNLNGTPIDQLAVPGTKAVILFFTATDCPISNRYIPEVQRLQKEFEQQGVTLWYVYPNAGETPFAVRQHEVAYGAEEHVLLDPHHRLVSFARARFTPEAAILVPNGADPQNLRVVYRGRIDNRYIHLGVQRPKATQHDLEEAIADVLQNHTVHQPDGPPVGCSIIGQP